MNPALLIARKDLRQRLRDKSAILFGIVAPLGLAVIFGFVFNPIQDSSFHATYAIVDQDGGPIAEAFIEVLGAMENEGIVTLRDVDSVEEAEEQVEVASDPFAEEEIETASAAFVLPEGLSESVLAGEGGEMTVIGMAGSSLGAQVAYAVADGFAAELGAVDVAVKTVLPSDVPPDPAVVGALVQQASAVPNPIAVEDISAATKQLDSTTYMAAAMAIFFVFFTVQFGVSGLLEEKQLGTMSRLLAAPVDRRSIIAGKALTTFALGVISMTVLVVATTLILGAEWGHPLGVGLLILAAVVSGMGILAIVASVAKTQEQAGNFGAIISVMLGFMGGTFFPISQVGGLLEKLSLLTPHAWFLRGLGDLAGGGVAAALPSVAALLAFGAITGGAAWVFLVRAVGR